MLYLREIMRHYSSVLFFCSGFSFPFPFFSMVLSLHNSHYQTLEKRVNLARLSSNLPIFICYRYNGHFVCYVQIMHDINSFFY